MAQRVPNHDAARYRLGAELVAFDWTPLRLYLRRSGFGVAQATVRQELRQSTGAPLLVPIPLKRQVSRELWVRGPDLKTKPEELTHIVDLIGVDTVTLLGCIHPAMIDESGLTGQLCHQLVTLLLPEWRRGGAWVVAMLQSIGRLGALRWQHGPVTLRAAFRPQQALLEFTVCPGTQNRPAVASA